MANKVIRSVCYFTDNPSDDIVAKVNNIANKLTDYDYIVQTKRLCSSTKNIKDLDNKISDKSFYLSIGTVKLNEAKNLLIDFYNANNVAFNVDLTSENISKDSVELLFDIIKNKPQKTFSFTFVFNNQHSSPYFPSANYYKNGFSVGLQPTDLSENCKSLNDWFTNIKTVWDEICEIFKADSEFLGIDSSVAPIFDGKGSLVNFIKKLGMSFDESVTTDTYLQITKFLKENNPKPVGLFGLMMPCLEDFELAEEYEQGNFSVERNIFLSLHSGLGIDTYPIGVDENFQRVVQILRLVQGLSNKYQKPLSVRFVSDGKAKIGERTDFENQYLKDVTTRSL